MTPKRFDEFFMIAREAFPSRATSSVFLTLRSRISEDLAHAAMIGAALLIYSAGGTTEHK